MAEFDFSLGSIGGTLVDLYGIKTQGEVAVAQEQISQAAADRAYAQAASARSFAQENQNTLLILAGGLVILFAFVWRRKGA